MPLPCNTRRWVATDEAWGRTGRPRGRASFIMERSRASPSNGPLDDLGAEACSNTLCPPSAGSCTSCGFLVPCGLECSFGTLSSDPENRPTPCALTPSRPAEIFSPIRPLAPRLVGVSVKPALTVGGEGFVWFVPARLPGPEVGSPGGGPRCKAEISLEMIWARALLVGAGCICGPFHRDVLVHLSTVTKKKTRNIPLFSARFALSLMAGDPSSGRSSSACCRRAWWKHRTHCPLPAYCD